MGWNLFGGLMPPAVDTAEEKERRHSGDSGNCSEAEEGQKIELEFQLTQSLLSRVKANEGNKGANSGKQAQLDLERMDFVIQWANNK